MSFGRPPEPVSSAGVLIHILILVLAAVLILSLSWTGFTASDDSYYIAAGRGWLHDFPFVAEYFGTMREFVAVPIALSFRLLGDTEFAAVLPTALYFFATVLLTYAALTRLVGPHAAFVAALLMLTVPLFALKATIPSADLPELFFAALSFWMFWWACGRARRGWLLFGAGMAAGAAALSHELALALPLFYACLFLVGFRLPRIQYFLILFGFLAVIGLNVAYYWTLTGDPLYRLHLVLEGTTVSVDRVAVPPFHFDDAGNFHIWAGIDPLVMLLGKQEFALLFYLALPAMVWLSSRRLELAPGAVERRVLVLARVLTLLAVVSFLFAAVVLMQAKLLPRYFILPAYCGFVVTMLAGTLLWRARRLTLVAVLVLVFAGCNLLAIELDNRNPRFGERALAAFVKSTAEPVYTDPMTADKAENFLMWARVLKVRVRTTPPEPGALYFHNPRNTSAPNRLMPPAVMPLYQPQPHWTRIWIAREEPRLIQRVVDGLGLGPVLPERIYRKLAEPNPPVAVYRLDRIYADASLTP